MSSGDLTDLEWRILDPLLPDRGERGPAIPDKRRTVNGILWVLRTGAPWRDMPERYGNWNSVFIRFGEVVLGGFRDTGEPWAGRRHRACHRLHDRAGAPACSWRKRGNQNQEALGRSRGGVSTKIHLRTNAKGDPLTFDVTGGEVQQQHQCRQFRMRRPVKPANPVPTADNSLGRSRGHHCVANHNAATSVGQSGL